tara:strand:+ start:867 stop:1016 length:150 start_codon:yes stop_codon:yes gene_type:complete
MSSFKCGDSYLAQAVLKNGTIVAAVMPTRCEAQEAVWVLINKFNREGNK